MDLPMWSRAPVALRRDLRQRLHRRSLACASAATLVLLAVGIWTSGPWILEEHARMESWTIPWHWLGDAIALAWFGRFVARHVILGEPLDAYGRRSVGGGRLLWTVGLSLFGGALLDLGFTLHHLHEERAGFERSVATSAVVDRIEVREYLGATYRLHCRLADATGAAFSVVVTARQEQDRPPPDS